MGKTSGGQLLIILSSNLLNIINLPILPPPKRRFSMQNTYVDFRAVKEVVSIRMALDHYGVNWLRKNGEELRGRCPIHKGEGTDTFHASLAKNAFNCFSCKA